MSSSEKNYLNRNFAAGLYLPEAQNHISPSPYMCSILIHTGKGGRGELNQRDRERGKSSNNRVENTNMTDCISSL
jgi:hypothetical protein